jgi:hypothetical protein
VWWQKTEAVVNMLRQSVSRKLHHLAGQELFITASPHAVSIALEDLPLFELAEELNAALHTFHAAASDLSRAERKLAQMERCEAIRDLPEWFLSCEAREASARAVMDALYEQIAETPAHTKAGLSIKLRLVGAFYCNDPSPARDDVDSDAPSRLLGSIIDDVGIRMFQK